MGDSLPMFARLLEILASSTVLKLLKSTGRGSHERPSAGAEVKLSDLARSDSSKLDDFVLHSGSLDQVFGSHATQARRAGTCLCDRSLVYSKVIRLRKGIVDVCVLRD